MQIEARPFDIAAEARLHLGKPYKFGAKFKTDGTQAFDCSYLTDYLYSLIGLPIGHTAHEQFKQGRPVEIEDLVPGDLLFRGGPWKQLEAKERGGVSHVALYVGGGKIIHAADYTRDQAGQWTELKDQVVKEDPVEVMAQDPDYLGARRMAENLGDFMTAPAVPWWRPDLREAQDLVEEIVRVLGYERVPGRIPDWRPQEVAFDTIRPKRRRLQRALYGAGLFEVMTYSFVSEEQLMETGLDPKHHLKLKNPLSSEQAYLRSSLLPSHLSVLGRNRNYAKDLAYYELSRVFQKREPGEQPYEPTHLAITMLRPDQVYAYLKGVLDAVAAELGVPLTVAHSPERGPYADGRSGIVKLGNQELGWIGQLDPELLGRHKVSGEAAYLELNVDLLLAHTQSRQFTGLDRFPVTQRDLAVLLPAEVTWQAVAAALADLPQTRVSFVSDYYGEGMPAGHKSLALRLVVAHPDRTPTDAEAVDVERKALSILGRTFGAVARGN